MSLALGSKSVGRNREAGAQRALAVRTGRVHLLCPQDARLTLWMAWLQGKARVSGAFAWASGKCAARSVFTHPCLSCVCASSLWVCLGPLICGCFFLSSACVWCHTPLLGVLPPRSDGCRQESLE